MEYDVQEVRRIAGKVHVASEDLLGVSSGDLARIRSDIPGNLEGGAADALTEVLEDLIEDTKKLGNGLETISAALYAFARKLKLADEEAARMMENA